MTNTDYNRAWVTHITILKAPEIDKFLERIYKDKMVPIKADSFFKKKYLFNSKGDSTQLIQGLDTFFKGSNKDVADLKKVELCFYSDYALLLSTFAVRKDPTDNFEKLKTETWARNREGDTPEKGTKELHSVISYILKQIAKNYTSNQIENDRDNSSEIEIITPGNYVCEKNRLHEDWKKNKNLLFEPDSLGSSFMFVMASTSNSQENKQSLQNIEQIPSCQCKKNYSYRKYEKSFSNNYTFSQPAGQSIVRFSSNAIGDEEYNKYLTLFTQTLIQKIDCYLRSKNLEENKKITKEEEKEANNLLEQTKELKRKIDRNLNTTAEGIATVWLATTDSKGLLDDISSSCLYIMEYKGKKRKEKTQEILAALTALTIISALNDSISLIKTENYPEIAKIFGIIGIFISCIAFLVITVAVIIEVISFIKKHFHSQKK